MSDIDEKTFTCPYCDAEFKTKQGLARHLKRCDAAPDEEEETKPMKTSGIPLYAEPAPKPEPEDDDDCICPECGYTAKYEFPVCPKCGVELEWD